MSETNISKTNMGLGKTNKHEKEMDGERNYTGKQLYGEKKNMLARQMYL